MQIRNFIDYNIVFIFTGFEKPSAIQQRAIRPLLKGRDVIAQAQSGTGKTATFSISILQSIDTTVRETQVTLYTTDLRYKESKKFTTLSLFLHISPLHYSIAKASFGYPVLYTWRLLRRQAQSCQGFFHVFIRRPWT